MKKVLFAIIIISELLGFAHGARVQWVPVTHLGMKGAMSIDYCGEAYFLVYRNEDSPSEEFGLQRASEDGINWSKTIVRNAPGLLFGHQKLFCGDQYFSTTNVNGTILSSVNALDWFAHEIPAEGRIAFLGMIEEQCFAFSDDGRTYRSLGGQKWEEIVDGPFAGRPTRWAQQCEEAVMAANENESGSIQTWSFDGSAWQAVGVVNFSGDLEGTIDLSSGFYVNADEGSGFDIGYSEVGFQQVWSTLGLAESRFMYPNIKFNDRTLVGTEDRLLSIEGENVLEQASYSVSDFAGSDARVLALDEDGAILETTDGINWHLLVYPSLRIAGIVDTETISIQFGGRVTEASDSRGFLMYNGAFVEEVGSVAIDYLEVDESSNVIFGYGRSVVAGELQNISVFKLEESDWILSSIGFEPRSIVFHDGVVYASDEEFVWKTGDGLSWELAVDLGLKFPGGVTALVYEGQLAFYGVDLDVGAGANGVTLIKRFSELGASSVSEVPFPIDNPVARYSSELQIELGLVSIGESAIYVGESPIDWEAIEKPLGPSRDHVSLGDRVVFLYSNIDDGVPINRLSAYLFESKQWVETILPSEVGELASLVAWVDGPGSEPSIVASAGGSGALVLIDPFGATLIQSLDTERLTVSTGKGSRLDGNDRVQTSVFAKNNRVAFESIDGVNWEPVNAEFATLATNQIASGASILSYADGETSDIYFLDIDDFGGELTESRFLNLSNRSFTGDGGDKVVMGFVVEDNEVLTRITARNVGPGLEKFGISDFASDPVIELLRSGESIAINDDWEQVDFDLGAGSRDGFVFAEGSNDSQIKASLDTGVYTIRSTANPGGEGIALSELYISSDALVNLSTKSKASSGSRSSVLGFVVGGDYEVTLLIRAIGPSLVDFGQSGFMVDPQIELFSGSFRLAINDDWAAQTDSGSIVAAAETLSAFPLSQDSKDAAMLVTVKPGVYTAKASSIDDSEGIVLLEIYLIDSKARLTKFAGAVLP